MKLKKISCLLLVLFLILINTLTVEADTDRLENFIQKQFDKSKAPGMVVVIVKGDQTIYSKGLGVKSKKTNSPVTLETLFEIGSTSKAYTALGLMLLEEKGLIGLDDPVTKYIPWFQMKYKGKPVQISLEQFLHHTSGVPFNSIVDIPVSSEEDAIEKTVKSLVGKELDSLPGEHFSYATINYDVLGLVIEKVSGKSYEKYMKEEIFDPMGLISTTANRQQAQKLDMAEGYKIAYGQAKNYNAPEYRGNAPAGYIITNGDDIAKWIKYQMKTYKAEDLLEKALDKTHIANRRVPPDWEGASYGGGWLVYQKGEGEYSHGGENPNYSSHVILRPDEQLGVAVLCNMNTNYPGTIAHGIMDILNDKIPKQKTKDIYRNMDCLALAIICIGIPFALFTLWKLFLLTIQIMKKKCIFKGTAMTVIACMTKFIMILSAFAGCIYMIPNIMLDGLNWGFLRVWAPESISVALVLFYSAIVIFTLYYYLNKLFSTLDDKNFFSVIILSILSGFGNAMIIFVINLTLSKYEPNQSIIDLGMLFYFIVSMTIYVVGQKVVRLKLISITNNIVFNKRMHLVNRILNTDYQEIESMEKGDILACLNNDTETISAFANIVITAISHSVTLVCCFIYLGLISFLGLIASVAVALLALSLYFIVGSTAEKLWEKVRDNQSIFLKYINDLVYGFKELSINGNKRKEFNQDIEQSCSTYRDKNVEGNFKFANVFVMGELLFTFVIGAVVFLFPFFFKEIEGATLFQYVFIFLYMTGPIHGILGAIPEVMRVKISWNRIKQLEKKVSALKEKLEDSECEETEKISIELKNVEYSYKNNSNSEFKVGPINCSFRPGEVTFITGGNGSGKSTLAKLITGLYRPDTGNVLVNGVEIKPEGLGKYYSAIFSDYYLFDKLYGIDCNKKTKEIESKMKSLELESKLSIVDGKLSTTNLSTGQRKRIALMISYLEDRPVYLFDEWAADQDPEFRRIFYTELLPEFKRKGKCVIAITHDDGYFDTADKVIKMEMGKICGEIAYAKN